jgi:hypothetical protein
MKKYFGPLFLLLLFSGMSLLTSCNANKDLEDEQAFDLAALQSGTWTVDHVDVNSFDTQGNLTGTQQFPFGEGTDGGICTFVYGKNSIWTMNDNGEFFEARYSVDDRVIYTEGGGTWGLRKISATELELVLRSDDAPNPCDYTVTGAVYYLNQGID